MHTQIPRSSSSHHFQDAHSRWRALTHRTASSHSSFLYGVISTKIYCRPTCSARLARRANVVFYDTEDQALRDGFRPCKRCQPDNASFVGETEEVVTRVLALLHTKRDAVMMKPRLNELAQQVGVTPSYLCRVFKKTMGMTLGAYVREFEKDVSDCRTESSVESPGSFRPDVVDSATGFMTPAPTASSPAAPDMCPKGELAEQQVRNMADDLDLNFDIDEWLWTGGLVQEDFYNEDSLNDVLNEDVYKWAV